MQYSPPILNKECATYQVLNTILTTTHEDLLLINVVQDSIIISTYYPMYGNTNKPSTDVQYTKVFTKEELTAIHPDVYLLFLLDDKDVASLAKSTWGFWRKFDQKELLLEQEYHYFSNQPVSVGEPSNNDKERGKVIVVAADVYWVTKLKVGLTEVFVGSKGGERKPLTREECDIAYPGLLKAYLLGSALGFPQETILEMWRSPFTENTLQDADLPRGDLTKNL